MMILFGESYLEQYDFESIITITFVKSVKFLCQVKFYMRASVVGRFLH